MKRQHSKWVAILSVICLSILGLGVAFSGKIGKTVYAAATQEADLRLIFTTDLHGQLNNIEYETGAKFEYGGLTKAYTLIKEARKEVGYQNYMTFDVGDVLYNYSTEYIYSKDHKAVQPIYKAMNVIDYDAITLGNHEFDYGFEYIKNQITGAGFDDITVVSNVYDSKTGKPIWNENKIITKKIKTNTNKEVEVKVGIIGETIPKLSVKRENYLGVLKTEGIVESVQKQTKDLKARGADIIVVLAHSGFGDGDPDLNFKNVSYSITQIPGVDAVLCGHEHRLFPNKDKSSSYYQLKGVDKKTDLVNGKVLVMANDHGKSIGLADLKLSISSSGKVSVKSSKGHVREVDPVKTKADYTLNNYYGDWEEQLKEATDKSIATLSDDTNLSSYFGLLRDNAGIQLVNDAKISYGRNYILNRKPEYMNYPVIAASRYVKYGYSGADDYADIKGNITEAKLSQIQPYNVYSAIYKISGKQLREWLEWSASAYQTYHEKVDIYSKDLAALVEAGEGNPLIAEDWQENLGDFRIFDGVSYEINPASKPRYDRSGKKINDTNRIMKLQYNGVNVTDSMQFILVTDLVSKTTEATKNIDNQSIYVGYNRDQISLIRYIKECAKSGKISYAADNNWILNIPGGYNFLYKTPVASLPYVKNEPWYHKTVKTAGDYAYIKGYGNQVQISKQTPSIVVTSTNTKITNNPYKLLIDVYVPGGIAEIKYEYGQFDEDSYIWSTAYNLNGREIYVSKNCDITVYVKGNNGKIGVRQIKITNIDEDHLEVPSVKSYTNRMSRITGSAQPNATVYIKTLHNTYETVVEEDGTFSYALPNQKSGTVLQVWVEDDQDRKSEKVSVTVKRTGPNRPDINEMSNTRNDINGCLNDDDALVVAVSDDTVYVSRQDGKKNYMESEIYNKKYRIVEATQRKDGNKDFRFYIPFLRVGSKVTIYSIDHLGRASRPTIMTVQSKGPNKPIVNEVMNIERNVTGRVTSPEGGKDFTVYAMVRGNLYSAKADVQGYFDIKVGKLAIGDEILIYATDTYNEKLRKSYTTRIKVKSVLDFIEKENEDYIKAPFTTKMDKITVYNEAFEDIYVSINKVVYKGQANDYGRFTIDLDERLKEGTVVYAYTRFKNDAVYQVEYAKVVAATPERPEIVNTVFTEKSRTIKVQTDEACTMIMDRAGQRLAITKHVYNKENNCYEYTFRVKGLRIGETIKFYAKNKAGYSKSSKMEVTSYASYIAEKEKKLQEQREKEEQEQREKEELEQAEQDQIDKEEEVQEQDQADKEEEVQEQDQVDKEEEVQEQDQIDKEEQV